MRHCDKRTHARLKASNDDAHCHAAITNRPVQSRGKLALFRTPSAVGSLVKAYSDLPAGSRSLIEWATRAQQNVLTQSNRH